MDPTAGFGFAAGLAALGAVVHYVRNQVAHGRIRRNSAVGIRTKATMASDEAWYAGHAAASPLLTASFLSAYTPAAACLLLALTSSRSPAAGIVAAAGAGSALTLLTAAAIKANSIAASAGDPEGRSGTR
ncbi:SdpI family protein [Streptomyces sp. NPDC048659]|uniref:SdpI family protein n=1 Tax=Streptomyces sp. NPDC048659 TaxID=3155489 RepID=UPI00343D5AB4